MNAYDNFGDEALQRRALLSQMGQSGAPSTLPVAGAPAPMRWSPPVGGQTAQTPSYSPPSQSDTKWIQDHSSEGPGGFSGHNQDPGYLDFQKSPTSPGGAGRDVAVAAGGNPYQAKSAAMQLEGFDSGKLADLSHNSPKYVFARAAQGLGMGDTEELVRRLKADPSGYFSGATLSGDTLSGLTNPEFNGVNSFDVIKGAKAGGQAWQWLPNGGGQPAAGAPTAMPAVGNIAGQIGHVMQGGTPQSSDQIKQIMAQLSAQANDPNRATTMPIRPPQQSDGLDQAALRSLLGQ